MPRADAAVDTETPDPFQYLLTSCAVVVPSEGVAELRDITQYQDIHATAASNVLAARGHYRIEDPYDRDETPDSRPTFGLDDGKPTALSSRTRSPSTAFSPTSSVGRTSR